MAKDDYDVMVYKILLYLYGVMKRKISFQEASFNMIVSRAKSQRNTWRISFA